MWPWADGHIHTLLGPLENTSNLHCAEHLCPSNSASGTFSCRYSLTPLDRAGQAGRTQQRTGELDNVTGNARPSKSTQPPRVRLWNEVPDCSSVTEKEFPRLYSACNTIPFGETHTAPLRAMETSLKAGHCVSKVTTVKGLNRAVRGPGLSVLPCLGISVMSEFPSTGMSFLQLKNNIRKCLWEQADLHCSKGHHVPLGLTIRFSDCAPKCGCS